MTSDVVRPGVTSRDDPVTSRYVPVTLEGACGGGGVSASVPASGRGRSSRADRQCPLGGVGGGVYAVLAAAAGRTASDASDGGGDGGGGSGDGVTDQRGPDPSRGVCASDGPSPRGRRSARVGHHGPVNVRQGTAGQLSEALSDSAAGRCQQTGL